MLAIEALTTPVPARSTQIEVERKAHNMAPHPAIEAVVDEAGDDEAMTARQLFRVLRDASPDDTVLVEETPSNLADLHAEWPIARPDSFYAFAGRALGWDLPAAVDFALSECDSGRNRPVLLVLGDGSMQYTVQAIYTAAQHRLPLVIVVPANREYAILKAFGELEKSPNVPGFDTPGLQLAILAQGDGAQEWSRGHQVRWGPSWCRRGADSNRGPIDPTAPNLT